MKESDKGWHHAWFAAAEAEIQLLQESKSEIFVESRRMRRLKWLQFVALLHRGAHVTDL